MLRTVRRWGTPNCLKNCSNGSLGPKGLCICTPSSTRLVLMLTTAGLSALVSSTQFGAGTVAAAGADTARSVHSWPGAAWPTDRCGAMATRATTALTTTAMPAVR